MGHANRLKDNPDAIKHCYHWLKDDGRHFLTAKYEWAKAHNGEFSFFTTAGNGNAAGDGIYCAKTPMSSVEYGNRVIRLDLVDDVVIHEKISQKYTIGGVEVTAKQALAKGVDMDYYRTYKDDAWYVIRQPEVIKGWSTNGDQIKSDLQFAAQDGLDKNDLNETLKLMDAEIASNSVMTSFVNTNARVSISDLLKSPEKISSLKKMMVLHLLLGERYLRTTDISDATLDDLIQNVATLLYKDSSADPDELAHLNENFPDVNLLGKFSNFLAQHLDEVNPRFLFRLTSTNDSLVLSDEQKQKIVSKILNEKSGPAFLRSTMPIENRAYIPIIIANLKKINSTDLTKYDSDDILGLCVLINYYANSNADVNSLITDIIYKVTSENSLIDMKNVYSSFNGRNNKFGGQLLAKIAAEKRTDLFHNLAFFIARGDEDLSGNDRISLAIGSRLLGVGIAPIEPAKYLAYYSYYYTAMPVTEFIKEMIVIMVEDQQKNKDSAFDIPKFVNDNLPTFFNNIKSINSKFLDTLRAITEYLAQPNVRYDYALLTYKNMMVQKMGNDWLDSLLTGKADPDDVTLASDILPKGFSAEVLEALVAKSKLSKNYLQMTLKYLNSRDFATAVKENKFDIKSRGKGAINICPFLDEFSKDQQQLSAISKVDTAKFAAKKNALAAKFCQ
jgi:hypothetical protein